MREGSRTEAVGGNGEPAPGRDAGGVPGLRGAIVPILLAFLASRALLLLVAAVVEATLPLSYHGATASHAPILGSLTGEDAVYYLGIAANGYHLASVSGPYVDWVFFPAFPILARLASLAVGDVALAGVLVANAATLAALVAVYALSESPLGRPAALTAVALVAFAPGAVAFGMAYSDSLLLAAVAGAMLAARTGRPWLMAILFAVATLSRPPGILYGLPLAAAVWAHDRRPLRLAWLASGPLALAGFSLYQGAVLGDPLAWIHGQERWNAVTGQGPSALPAVATAGTTAPLVALLFAGLLAFALLLGLALRDRLAPADLLVALVALASVFVAGRLQSDLRYLAIGWPFAWVVARRVASAGRDLVGLAVGGLYVLFAFLNVTQALAP